MNNHAVRNVSVYGSHNGRSKRWEFQETEENLKPVLRLAVRHPPKKSFPRFNPFPNVVLGDQHTDIVKLDFDNTVYDEVLLWAYRTLFWFKLGGFIIFQSSIKNYVVKRKGRIFYCFKKGSYHVIFNRPVDWAENVRIMNWVALESGNEGLRKYVIMQCIKRTSTLRISPKGKKPIPKPIFHYGLQDEQIKVFLKNRMFVLDFLKEESRKR